MILKIPLISSTKEFNDTILAKPEIGFSLLNFGCKASFEKLKPPMKIEPTIAMIKTIMPIPKIGIAIFAKSWIKMREPSS